MPDSRTPRAPRGDCRQGRRSRSLRHRRDASRRDAVRRAPSPIRENPRATARPSPRAPRAGHRLLRRVMRQGRRACPRGGKRPTGGGRVRHRPGCEERYRDERSATSTRSEAIAVLCVGAPNDSCERRDAAALLEAAQRRTRGRRSRLLASRPMLWGASPPRPRARGTTTGTGTSPSSRRCARGIDAARRRKSSSSSSSVAAAVDDAVRYVARVASVDAVLGRRRRSRRREAHARSIREAMASHEEDGGSCAARRR